MLHQLKSLSEKAVSSATGIASRLPSRGTTVGVIVIVVFILSPLSALIPVYQEHRHRAELEALPSIEDRFRKLSWSYHCEKTASDSSSVISYSIQCSSESKANGTVLSHMQCSSVSVDTGPMADEDLQKVMVSLRTCTTVGVGAWRPSLDSPCSAMEESESEVVSNIKMPQEGVWCRSM